MWPENKMKNDEEEDCILRSKTQETNLVDDYRPEQWENVRSHCGEEE